jgi:tetratricopeptide (TPR) repeat protein
MIGAWRRSVALLTTLVVASASPVLAQPRTATPKQKQAAKVLVNKALEKSAAGDHNAAIDLYRQAFDIFPDSFLLTNIGFELLQSGNPQDALRYFCTYLEKEPEGGNAEYATSQAKIAQAQLGNNNVTSRNVCEAPPKVEDKEAEKDKDKDKERAGATVLDPPGPGLGVVVDTPPPRSASKLPYIGIATAALGVAAVAVGFYEGAQAQDITNQINSRADGMPWQDDIRSLQTRGQSYENRQIGFLIGGGVLVATGAVLYVLGRASGPEPAASASKATVQMTPTTNGFAVLGTF